jgi:hypothetical protein
MRIEIKNFLDKLDNDLNPIKEQAIKYYDIDSTIRAKNVVQIFKRPWIAPENFGLVLYPPVEKSWLVEFEKKTGKVIPKIYENVLLQMNGCFVYDFSLFGLPKSIYTKGVLDRSVLQQFDLTTANISWIREYEIDQDLFHIGGRAYSYSENIGYFVDKETILSIKETGEVVNSFATIRDFFVTEIEVAEKMMIAERDENGLQKH